MTQDVFIVHTISFFGTFAYFGYINWTVVLASLSSVQVRLTLLVVEAFALWIHSTGHWWEVVFSALKEMFIGFYQYTTFIHFCINM